MPDPMLVVNVDKLVDAVLDGHKQQSALREKVQAGETTLAETQAQCKVLEKQLELDRERVRAEVARVEARWRTVRFGVVVAAVVLLVRCDAESLSRILRPPAAGANLAERFTALLHAPSADQRSINVAQLRGCVRRIDGALPPERAASAGDPGREPAPGHAASREELRRDLERACRLLIDG